MGEGGTVGSPARTIKRGGGLLIGLGIALVILGFLAVGAPLVTGVAVAITVGFFVVVTGILEVVMAFKAQSWGKGILSAILGALSIVAGALMIAHPLMGLGFLTILVAAYFLVHGFFEIIEAFQLRPAPGWGWELFSGILTLILGILIWRQWPVSGAWAIGVLVGIHVLMSGWAAIMLGAAARGAVSGTQGS
jgi:uncharacterized membrane protein HdeD (DUF308 family)